MATLHEQSSYTQYAVPMQEEMLQPASPTLTNPDLILPNEIRYSAGTSLAVSDFSYNERPTSQRQSHIRSGSDGSGAEVGVATAVMMPVRLSVGPPSNITKPTHLSSYQGYEHGAPLSDIGEEETEPEDNTDGGRTPTEKDESSDPSEMDEIAAELEKLAAPPLRHKKRLSNISVGSTDSDKADWEKFDTTKLISDRVAADIVKARHAADDESVASRRNSKENDEEMSILNDRAEQILEKARKRLSHMEDNLTKARHSMTLSTSKSSPNMHEVGLGQSPGGGLYRSISQAGANRRSRGFPVKPNTIMSHGRAGSDNVVSGAGNRSSRTPELRSVSALEYSRPWLGATTPEKLQSGHSPSSSRSFNSPLRILTEEAESPSTIQTSPDSGSTPTYLQQRGLGIHSSAAKAQEDLSQMSRHDHSGTPTSIERSNSQASTRSARDLKDQMTEMKSRIAELRSKAQADSLRRRSVQNLRSSSPFNSSSPEVKNTADWRPASPAYHERAETSLGHNTGAGEGWRSISQQSQHRRKDSALDEDATPSRMPVTPTMARLMNVSTPAGASSARTDRNTPSLAYKNGHVESDFDSHDAHSNYEAAEEQLANDEDDEEVYANEEEQIYLNEVLEESLHEPDVPSIPIAFLTQGKGGEERHEDRLDAFDYENMFLHSAMGTYTGRSDSDDESDADSVETSRRANTTPIADEESDDSDESVHERDLNDSDDENSDGSSLSPASPSSSQSSPTKRHTVLRNGEIPESARAPMKTGRSNSMESASSAATFETATEGLGRDLEDDDSGDGEDSPDEILNWATEPEHRLSTFDHDQTLASSPLGAIVGPNNHNRHDSGSGMDSGTRNVPGPLHPQAQSARVPNLSVATNAPAQRFVPRSANYNGHIPRYSHSRNQSNETEDSTDGQTTPLASSFPLPQTSIPRPRVSHTPSSSSSSSGHVRNSSTSTVIPARQPPSQLPRSTKHSPSPSTSSSIPVQRKLSSRNGSRQQAQSANSARSARSASSTSTASTPASVHPANTEILMESLIKLADPSFSIRPDTRFAEMDKELVLNLLRALGGVCDGILRADKQGESAIVKNLRGRLSDCEEVLLNGLGTDDDDDDDDGDDGDGADDEEEQEVVNAQHYSHVDGAVRNENVMQPAQGLGIHGATQHRLT